jgi:UDP:flavonoid glycosyltransferase YjiC (YdhE family)
VRIRKHASTRRLARTITRALADPDLKRGAQRMAEALARSDGADAIAEALESIPATR